MSRKKIKQPVVIRHELTEFGCERLGIDYNPDEPVLMTYRLLSEKLGKENTKMGNTRHISFEAEIPLSDSDNPFLGEYIHDMLLDASHGDHVSVSVEQKGYLYSNKNDNNPKAFVIGCLTTHSMRGADVIGFFKTHAPEFTVYCFDLDFPSCIVFDRPGADGDLRIYEMDPDQMTLRTENHHEEE